MASNKGTNRMTKKITNKRSTLVKLDKQPLAPALSLAAMAGKLLDANRRLSANTRAAYKADVVSFDAWRAGRMLSKTTVELYANAMLGEGQPASTVNRRLAAVRWLARQLREQSLDDRTLSAAVAAELARQAERVAEVPSVRDVNANKPAAGRYVKPAEFDAVLRGCIADNSPAGYRDAALLLMAYSTGLRVSELAALSMASVTFGAGYVELEVYGKGGKLRKNYIADGAAGLLEDWLELRGKGAGSLFAPVGKGGRIAARHISRQALDKLLRNRIAEAGLRSGFSWHDLRRTFISDRWRDNWDGAMLAATVGHAKLDQTAAYDRRPEDMRRNAALELFYNVPARAGVPSPH